MATKKKGTLTGHQDIEGNDIRVGDLVEDIHTGKVYLINKYGNLFSEKYGTRKISGMNVRIVDPTLEKLEEALVPAPAPEDIPEEIPEEVAEILENIPEAPAAFEDEPEDAPAEEEAPIGSKEAGKILEDALDRYERIEQEAAEVLADEFFARVLRDRGYTVKAEKEIRYIKSL